MARALVDSLGEKLKAAGIDQGEQRVKCARMHVSPPADPDKHGGFFTFMAISPPVSAFNSTAPWGKMRPQTIAVRKTG